MSREGGNAKAVGGVTQARLAGSNGITIQTYREH